MALGAMARVRWSGGVMMSRRRGLASVWSPRAGFRGRASEWTAWSDPMDWALELARRELGAVPLRCARRPRSSPPRGNRR